MNNATRAALLSALLFPGWGQIYLKRYKRGIAIIIPTIACILSICYAVILVAHSLIKKMPVAKGKVTFDIVLQFTMDAVKEINLFYLGLMIALLIALWLVSIIDAYLLGKKQLPDTSAVAAELPAQSGEETETPGTPDLASSSTDQVIDTADSTDKDDTLN